MGEFSKPQYAVDVLKVEVPVTMAYVKGTRACKSDSAYTRDEAKEHFRKAAAAAKKPFIYLSAGVSNDTFTETLDLASETGVNFSGSSAAAPHGRMRSPSTANKESRRSKTG